MDKIDEINLKLGFVNATIAHGRITKESKERGLKIKQELEEELKRVTNALHNEYLKQYKVEHKDMLEDFLEERKKLALTARGVDKKVMWKRLIGGGND